MALEVAKKKTRQNLEAPWTVFTDSQKKLATFQQIFSYSSTLFLTDLIYQITLDLKDARHLVTIRWISSYVGLVEHNKTNQSAKNRAYRRRKPTENGIHLRKSKKDSWIISVKTCKMARDRDKQKRGKSSGFHFARLKAGMDKLLGSTLKMYASCYVQLQARQDAIDTFLVRIEVIEHPSVIGARK